MDSARYTGIKKNKNKKSPREKGVLARASKSPQLTHSLSLSLSLSSPLYIHVDSAIEGSCRRCYIRVHRPRRRRRPGGVMPTWWYFPRRPNVYVYIYIYDATYTRTFIFKREGCGRVGRCVGTLKKKYLKRSPGLAVRGDDYPTAARAFRTPHRFRTLGRMGGRGSRREVHVAFTSRRFLPRDRGGWHVPRATLILYKSVL